MTDIVNWILDVKWMGEVIKYLPICIALIGGIELWDLLRRK